jgi:hypothetical protein
MKVNVEVLPYEVIALAIRGDIIAMNLVLKHFEPYIIRLSQKVLFDEFGSPHIHVDPEIKRLLETKLIIAVMDFKL